MCKHRYHQAVSTHSRPKAAGYEHSFTLPTIMFQLTAARRRLAGGVRHVAGGGAFQLTAARRRLGH